MIRKFVLLLAAFGMLSTIPACTSKGSGGEEEILAEDGTSEELAGLALEEGGGDDSFADYGDSNDLSLDLDASVADTTTEDQLTIDSFGEGMDTAGMDLGAEPVPEPGTVEEPMAPEPMDMGASDMAAMDTSNEMMTPPAEEIAPPTTTLDEAPPAYMTDTSSTFQEPAEEEKPKNIPVQKVANEPWRSGSKWVNAIYFARPGDSLESISQTIYGDDRTSELKRINPTFNRREVKPGDKVYYASAVRPDDNGKVITYFEEKNMPSQTYVAKSGDNIRKVSRELLGYPEAWKEIWAYNPGVESKQEIAEGTELRYWDANAHLGGGSPAPLAEMAPSAPPLPSAPPVEEMGMNDLPPPPPMPEMGDMGEDPSMAQNDFAPPPDLPPPPDMDGGAGMGGMNTADLPPPPPPMDLPPPPPPPPPVQAAPPPAQASVDEGAMADQDQTVMMGAVAAGALMLVALMVVRRKRKQKELEQALGETHVG